MLRVAKLAKGGHAYYFAVTPGTGTGVEAAGRWVGRGPHAFGLRGPVTEAALGAALAGDHPVSLARLGPSHDRVVVGGFDLTFCAPKSVSLLHALGAPEVSAAVREAHERAVDAAVDYVERHALAVRRPDGGVIVPQAAHAVAGACFVHRVSRALDPHLHSHVVVPNLGRDRAGTFSALDGRGVYAHRSTVDALYHVQLRHELTTRLGLSFEPARNGRADVAGIGVEARRVFSQRAVTIAEHLAARGLGGSRARDIAGHATRPRRDLRRSPDDLRGRWEERARAVGLSARRLSEVVDRVPRRAGPGPEELAPDGVAAALAGRSTAARRDVVRAWCHALPAGAPAAAVERVADRLLDTMTPSPEHRARAERPGVGEPRYDVAERTVRRADIGRGGAVLARLLAARGMEAPVHAPQRGRAAGDDLGLGLG
ncbi:MAG TPA: MobF family relaxase [Acidimicrobiales bacterium]|nr:MobF family relaxase [Acidimicrobiales bacterium]